MLMRLHSNKIVLIPVECSVRLCAVCRVQSAVCGTLIHAVCGSVRSNRLQCARQCAAVRQCGGVRECAAMCAAVCAAVSSSVVETAVRHRVFINSKYIRIDSFKFRMNQTM
jgi:hypothetical protein